MLAVRRFRLGIDEGGKIIFEGTSHQMAHPPSWTLTPTIAGMMEE